MRLKSSGWFEVALMILSVVMFVVGSTYNPRARTMPEVLSVLLFVLALLVFLSENVPAASRHMGFMRQKGFFTNQTAKKEDETESSEPESGANEMRKLVRIILWLIGFVAVLKFVSYLITIPVWLLLFTRFEGGRSWRSSIGSAVGMGIFNYVLFAVLLHTTL